MKKKIELQNLVNQTTDPTSQIEFFFQIFEQCTLLLVMIPVPRSTGN